MCIVLTKGYRNRPIFDMYRYVFHRFNVIKLAVGAFVSL